MTATKRSLTMYFSADKALGAVGGGLAAASLGFGVYMNIHGPAASFGHSHDFTVFAQLSAPRTPRTNAGRPTTAPTSTEPLDMTATASIGKPDRAEATNDETRLDDETRIFSSVTLQTASDDAATILVDGRSRTVHIGDTLPNGSLVLEIRPGPTPSVKTSLGVIMASSPQN